MSNDVLSNQGRWWKRGIVLLCLAVIGGFIAMYLPDAMGSSDEGPRLTHKVTRGPLVISVIERGTLESSNNTEIECKVRGYNTVTWVVPVGTVVKKGDVLVRLDTKLIEESYSLTKTNTHVATATLARSKADVAKAEIAIDAYLKGRYHYQLSTLERELQIAESNLTTAQKMHDQTELLFQRGYVNDLEVKGIGYTVEQAQLEVKTKEAEINVLKKYTKEMELERLRGNIAATNSKLKADQAALKMELSREARAEQELAACVIKAERDGLVIYPSAAAWKDTPDITEGANVHKDQVLLLMPDLAKMQVKVGIHESIVDNIKKGLKAIVTLPDRTLEAKVSSVATATRPAGWWTGNVVKYDTIIKLPSVEGLKPGMSAEVEVIIDRHEDVLTVPVAAIVEAEEGNFCWVKTSEGPQRRLLELGDSNDVFVEVKTGVKEGDEVILDPAAFEKKEKEDEGADAKMLDGSE